MKEDFKSIAVTPDQRLYACADGRFVSVAAAEPRTWAALCNGPNRPDLAYKLGLDGAGSQAVAEQLEAVFATGPATTWIELLAPLGAATNPINSGRDIIDDPHNRSRDAIVVIDGEPVPASPIRMSDISGERNATDTRPPPLLGEHGDALLKQAGFSLNEIEQLWSSAVI